MNNKMKFALNFLLVTLLLIFTHILSEIFHIDKTVFVIWIGTLLAGKNYVISRKPDSLYDEQRTFIGLVVMVIISIIITAIYIIEAFDNFN